MSDCQAGVWVGLLAALTILVPAPDSQAIQGEDPSLDSVLARVGEYITEFRRQLSGIVGEERYEQRATPPPTTSFRSTDQQYRELRSDFLLVRPEGEERFFEFRDVFEDPEVRATVDVRYESDPAIGHLVLAEMRERYENRRNGSRVEGTVTYSRFRRFQVQVEETAPTRN